MSSSSSVTLTEAKLVLRTVSDCPIQKVVVYQPGARITRSLKVEATETGNYKIVVEGISTSCVKESISLSGFGECRIESVTIEEVKKRRIDIELDYKECTKNEINQKIDELKASASEERQIKQSLELNEKKKELVKTHVESQLISTPDGGYEQFKLPDSRNVFGFLDTYTDISAKIQEENFRANTELEVIKSKQKVVVDRLQALLGNVYIPLDSTDSCLERAISESKAYEVIDVLTVNVEMEVLTPCALDFEMTYLVDSARWEASYDVRCGDNTAVLYFFGNVMQWSKEDWSEVSLLLSSTNLRGSFGKCCSTVPSMSNMFVILYPEEKTPPTLPSQTIRFAKAIIQHSTVSAPRFASPDAFTPRLLNAEMECDDCVDYMETTVEGSGISTSYVIPRETTIMADSKSHKVTVATIQLPLQLFRYAVPSLSNSVFLQAKLVNRSDYHLLGSNSVSVYLENSFVGRTSLNERVAPTGLFYISVGLDPCISLTYIPPRPFAKESGFIGKTREESYEALTYLTSSGDDKSSVLIAVLSSFPSSTDAKIGVKLLEPEQATEIEASNNIQAVSKALELYSNTTTRAAFINSTTNHIIDVVKLTTKATLRTKYVISWPADKKIEIVKRK